jgi:pimeloyl-ACP methyl ester carboxylesterase
MAGRGLVEAIRPLLDRLPGPVRLRVGGGEGPTACLDPGQFATVRALFEAAGVATPEAVGPGAPLAPMDRVVLDYLLDGLLAATSAGARPLWAASRHAMRDGGGARTYVRLGAAGARPVLFFGAPGLPAELTSGWLAGLAAHCDVATVETRGLFGDMPGPADLGPRAQIDDARRLMAHLEWPVADIVGVCGGAALALMFAAEYPSACTTLALWFGDYDLAAAAPKTEHQENLKSLMEIVVEEPRAAGDVLAMLMSVLTRQASPAIAPLILYPFATEELFTAYCRMNHAVMSIDCAGLAARIALPSLVGYSAADATAHPAGSAHVARLLGAAVERLDHVAHLDGVRGRSADVDRTLLFQAAARAQAIRAA